MTKDQLQDQYNQHVEALGHEGALRIVCGSLLRDFYQLVHVDVYNRVIEDLNMTHSPLWVLDPTFEMVTDIQGFYDDLVKIVDMCREG